MKIDQLPVEILMKIFRFLPRYEEVSLVNKLFYDVACTVNDPNICLTIDEYFFEHNWLPSIRNSNRQISKMVIDFSGSEEANLRTSISIIEKFSISLKHLIFDCFDDVSMSEFLEILSLVPNVEYLDFDSLRLRGKTTGTASREQMSDNGELDLHQLKKLRFYRCDDAFLTVLNRLPAGKLTELELGDVNLNTFGYLFKRQPNIKKLHCAHSLGDYYKTTIEADILNHLTLESLHWWYSPRDSINNVIVLSKQTKLKALTMLNTEFDEDFVDLVSNYFTKLVTFSTDVGETPSAACIAMIVKLKSVNDLSLTFNKGSMHQFETLAQILNTGITELTMKCNHFGISTIHDFVKSVPKLKVLKMECRIDPQLFNAIVSNFNFVEVLKIDYYISDCQSTDSGSLNPKLKELIITNSKLTSDVSETAFLSKALLDYPNLRKLKITFASITTSQFRLILNGFTKLESLKLLKGVREMTIDDLNYLKNHKQTLKFISLGHLNFKITDELKRQFSAIFGVVTYDTGTLQMAVDRNTMNNEKW